MANCDLREQINNIFQVEYFQISNYAQNILSMFVNYEFIHVRLTLRCQKELSFLKLIKWQLFLQNQTEKYLYKSRDNETNVLCAFLNQNITNTVIEITVCFGILCRQKAFIVQIWYYQAIRYKLTKIQPVDCDLALNLRKQYKTVYYLTIVDRSGNFCVTFVLE
ncbi:Hypothetical_protein [Hexamita inflata]|uniref:Hypothetical_protein n=1 Tax=Hexamita inflata TaxID=28002 RepID=A0AA86PB58_9EUKA|nr:Hypothetical protein HINF_LOCUS22136 [Hexamita inflata]